MNNINFLTSGLVQSNTGNTINGVTNVNIPSSSSSLTSSTSSTSSSSTNSDCNIFPVSNTIDSTNIIYDGQTILMINSTLNQNANTVQATYFDPISGAPGLGSNPFSSWNFDLNNSSYLNAMFATSSLLNDDLALFNNMQPLNAGTGIHTFDILNTGGATNSTNGLFFSLTSNPYVYNPVTNNYLPNNPPTSQNCIPNYSNNNSDNFLFTSNYWVQQKNEIIIIELLFTVQNTAATQLNSTVQSPPTICVIIKNKVISKDVLAGLASSHNGLSSKVKVYTAGPVPLQFMPPNTSFISSNSYSFIYNNIPLIIAPGYNKLYATLPIAFIPARSNSTPQYLTSEGYMFDGSNNIPTFDLSSSTIVSSLPTTPSSYGYFVVGVAYSQTYSNYQSFASINAEILIKNIWRSPISIYNSYNQYSVNDMSTKQVVLLFGKSYNGGTFLVTNTGTPISAVNSYGVTSLRNFISIMRAVLNKFDGSVSLVDYFINQSVITAINTGTSYNANVVILQPLLDGGITNPSTILNNPDMYYLLVNNKNSANISIDTTNQSVFGQNIGLNYLGLSNSVLASVGSCNYKNNNLFMLSDLEGDLFANCVSLGLNTVSNQTYNILIILPEAQFNPQITTTNNILTIYSTLNTLFYINQNVNSAKQFVPQSNNNSKLMLSVSNTRLF